MGFSMDIFRTLQDLVEFVKAERAEYGGSFKIINVETFQDNMGNDNYRIWFLISTL